jgi:hypothetical protein
LPAVIRSSWVFVLRARATTGAERHPRSHQRMMSYRGEGDFQIWIEGRWRSHFLCSDRSAPLQARWISVPPGVWHQGVVSAGNWVVVSFHTAPEHELVEERLESGESGDLRLRKYLDDSGTRSSPSSSRGHGAPPPAMQSAPAGGTARPRRQCNRLQPRARCAPAGSAEGSGRQRRVSTRRHSDGVRCMRSALILPGQSRRQGNLHERPRSNAASARETLKAARVAALGGPSYPSPHGSSG